MNLIDDFLHGQLDALAGEVRPVADPLPGIRRSARHLGYRRAGVAAAVLALAGAGAVVGPWLADSPSGGGRTDPRLPVASSGLAADPAPATVFGHWSYAGDRDLLAAASETDLGRVVAAGVRAAAPGATPTGRAWTLWGGTIGQAGALVTVTEVRTGSGLEDLATLYLRAGTAGRAAVVQQVPSDATEVSFLVARGPGVPHQYVLVVGAPGTGQVSYALDGYAFRPVQQLPGYRGSLGPTGQGWALFPRPAGSGDAIQVRSAGDGALRYQGPIGPAEGPATAAQPAPACAATDLAVTGGQGQAGLGHAGIPLVFTNTGPGACTLGGYPDVTVLDAAATPAAHAAQVPQGYLGGLATGRSAAPTVTLQPGQSAAALLEGSNTPTGDAASCPTYPQLLVSLPGGGRQLRLPVTAPGCSAFQVHPLLAGTTGTEAG